MHVRNIIGHSNIYVVYPGQAVRLSQTATCARAESVFSRFIMGLRSLHTFTPVKEDCIGRKRETFQGTRPRYRSCSYQHAHKNDNSISDDIHYKRYIYYGDKEWVLKKRSYKKKDIFFYYKYYFNYFFFFALRSAFLLQNYNDLNTKW